METQHPQGHCVAKVVPGITHNWYDTLSYTLKGDGHSKTHRNPLGSTLQTHTRGITRHQATRVTHSSTPDSLGLTISPSSVSRSLFSTQSFS